MNKHGTVVPPSRLFVVLLRIVYQQVAFSGTWTTVHTYGESESASTLTGKGGENGQSSDRVAKPCTGQTVGCLQG